MTGPLTGPERPILEAMLRHQRRTLLDVCAGLTAQQLADRAVPPSSLSLLGLVRHMAKVERIWLRTRVAGEDVEPLHGFGGPRRDVDFDDAVADVPLEHEIDFRGEPMSSRMVLVHLVQEYARHDGHADLMREAIDGVTGR